LLASLPPCDPIPSPTSSQQDGPATGNSPGTPGAAILRALSSSASSSPPPPSSGSGSVHLPLSLRDALLWDTLLQRLGEKKVERRPVIGGERRPVIGEGEEEATGGFLPG